MKSGPGDQAGQRAAFFANVGHDLKTPLNGIIGFASVLLADLAGDPERVRQVRMIYTSAQKLLARIEAFLDYTRLEAGQLQLRPEWILPGDFLRQLAEPLRPEAEQSGMRIEVRSQQAPSRIRTDARLLGRVLGELLTNAVRYGQQGRIEASVRALPQCVVGFELRDEGIGMAAEALGRLRESLSGTGFEGLGLGLAIARQAAGALGGRVEVDSEPGRGCVFQLVLQLARGDIEP
ncbi:MAG: HAMP domain-containing histidine kinase [Deltaproteobacteria bacterium]|nr:HAMP domain-containing histidine kinase [Deltaproteobacteria bacterium]